MEKRLSKLQKNILKRAYQNRTTEKRTDADRGADLYMHEILYHEYSFSENAYARAHQTLRKPGRHHFSKIAIGEKLYRSARAAVSRATRRLEERGLITRLATGSWAGCNLTKQGIETAKALMVNSQDRNTSQRG